MKRRTYFYLSPILLSIVVLSSCQHETNSEPDQNEQIHSNPLDAEPVVLGKELDMPYTVENIQTAFNNLLINLKGRSKNSKLAKIFKEGGGH